MQQQQAYPYTGMQSAVLDAEVAKYIRQGYRVISRTPTTAQLVKPKKLSLLWAIFWAIVGLGFGLLFYIAWYYIKSDKTVYLTVDAQGRIRKQ
jgi:hypothetical protein